MLHSLLQKWLLSSEPMQKCYIYKMFHKTHLVQHGSTWSAVQSANQLPGCSIELESIKNGLRSGHFAQPVGRSKQQRCTLIIKHWLCVNVTYGTCKHTSEAAKGFKQQWPVPHNHPAQRSPRVLGEKVPRNETARMWYWSGGNRCLTTRGFPQRAYFIQATGQKKKQQCCTLPKYSVCKQV